MDRRRLVAALLSVGLALTATEAAHALVLCKRKSGALALREACKKKETAVDASAIGTLGPAGAAAPSLRVVDANGRQVGDFTDRGSTVIFAVGEVSLEIAVGSDGFTQQVSFLHTSDDCSGDRYMSLFAPERLARFAGVVGTTAYYAVPPGQELTFAAFEFITSAADCTAGAGTVLPNGLCCSKSTNVINAALPATFDLGAYVPPFRVEVTP
jgi:hypothetical protein